jgi:hypothetical protein
MELPLENLECKTGRGHRSGERAGDGTCARTSK